MEVSRSKHDAGSASPQRRHLRLVGPTSHQTTRPKSNPEVRRKLLERVSPYLLSGPAPTFGSREWTELDPADPRWTAATVRAALAWWGPSGFGEDEADE
jgi:hypothetical protein